MDTARPGPSPEETAESFCYGHPKVPTKLRCSRCGRPICGRCAIPASVGQHCPECVAEARRNAPKVRTVLRAEAPGTFALIVINVVVYGLQQVVPGLTGAWVAFPPAIADGQWYRLITSMFLHASVWHIGFNMLALYYFGPVVERRFGTGRFALLYLVSGFVSSASSYLIEPPQVPSLGASGAIFGIFAVVMVLAFNRRHDPGANQLLRSLFGLLVLNGLLVFFVPNIDVWAHVGGFLGGIALGFAYDRGGRGAGKAAEAVVTVVLVAVAVAVIAARTAGLNGGSLL